tara:strand:+ start:9245 stop:10414 length:1170 start_codon:yes stop_codon:yes gene_type:complete
MNSSTPAIVVVAFNRPRSLDRLLKSLGSAHYPETSIPLIISIDKAENNGDVLLMAESFDWPFGDKKVNYQEENLGLRKHILQCMGYAAEYGSMILLEDDLFVAPGFYKYTVQALDFVGNDPKIAGISLYNHQFNVHVGQNFSPLEDGFDNWYFQFASSWGQAWTKTQTEQFLEWYHTSPKINERQHIPQNVRQWSDKSWLKFHIAYLVEKDLFFLYPKISLSTNFSDAGTHIGNDTTTYQVPLMYDAEKKYHFSKVSRSLSVYDAFFENTNLGPLLDLIGDESTIDLYGYQKPNKRFFLSSAILDFKVVRSFGKSLRPLDANIMFGIEGEDFFLYDTSVIVQNNKTKNQTREIIYQIKHLSHKKAGYLYWHLTTTRLKGLLVKLRILRK